jgi:hypothetical protein
MLMPPLISPQLMAADTARRYDAGAFRQRRRHISPLMLAAALMLPLSCGAAAALYADAAAAMIR